MLRATLRCAQSRQGQSRRLAVRLRYRVEAARPQLLPGRLTANARVRTLGSARSCSAARSQGLGWSCGAQSSSAEAALTRPVRGLPLEQCTENRSRFSRDIGVEVGIL